jgi:cytochrome P450
MRFRPPHLGILEESGPGYFIPARPAPPKYELNALQIVLAARHSLIAGWPEDAYYSGIDEFRILGRQVVVANSAASVKYVFATRHQNFDRKSPQMKRALQLLLGDGLFISEGETWKHRRPLVANVVHKNRVAAFGPTMEEAAGDIADRWSNLPRGTVINVLPEMAELTAEIIARSVFGRNLGSTAARRVIDGFTSYQSAVDSFNLGYFLGFDNGLPILRGPRLKRAVKEVQGVIDEIVAVHLAGHGEEGSILDLLIRRPEGSILDDEGLRNEAATIFMAGHETTATTLTWAWYLLSNAAWVEQAVHSELDMVVGDRRPTIDDVHKLDWCRGVIEETLRLYPPVPILARQARDADQIEAIHVEPAALILVIPWLLHRANDLWDRPAHFLPERFIGGQRPSPYTYIPFSVGPRICPGLNFGLTEAILCLAILAQRFKLRVVDGYKVEPQGRLTLRPRGGLPVVVTPRQ